MKCFDASLKRLYNNGTNILFTRVFFFVFKKIKVVTFIWRYSIADRLAENCENERLALPISPRYAMTYLAAAAFVKDNATCRVCRPSSKRCPAATGQRRTAKNVARRCIISCR